MAKIFTVCDQNERLWTQIKIFALLFPYLIKTVFKQFWRKTAPNLLSTTEFCPRCQNDRSDISQKKIFLNISLLNATPNSKNSKIIFWKSLELQLSPYNELNSFNKDSNSFVNFIFEKSIFEKSLLVIIWIVLIQYNQKVLSLFSKTIF